MTSGRNLFALLSGFFFLFLFSSSLLASPEELEAVRQQIRNNGARWQAEETSISKLPEERRRMRLGLLKRPPSVLESAPLVSTTPPTGTPPGALNYNLKSYVTPIRDQGSCGSCWAFATTAALESQYLMSTKGFGWSNNSLSEFSEQILLSCSTAGTCGGGYLDDASDFIQNTGLPLASCFPYTELNYTSGPDTPCADAACSFWQSQTYSINGWNWVANGSPTAAALENALDTYGPLVASMIVYSDFLYYAGGVYSLTPGALAEGGHAIEIIGYNHAGQYFIVKNSFGDDWGESEPGSVKTRGFFRIAYSELADSVMFGEETIAYTGYSKDPCSYSISPKSVTPAYTGVNNAEASVTSPSGCTWTAVSNAGWISVVSGATGTGDGTVTYSVAANNTTTQRVGKLTIAGKTLTVRQAAEPCTYSISPQSATPAYAGGNAKTSVTSLPGCTWTAVSNAKWVIVTSGGSGSGNGTVKYSVSVNNATTSRTGTLTIAGQTLTVKQAGK